MPAFIISKCSTRNKNSTHKSNNRTCIPFIEPLTPKSPLHYVSLNSGVFTLSLLHHKSGYTKSEPWAQDLRSPEPQFCPPSILPLQLLLSSDMDPLDHPAGQRCVPERKAKWMASRRTEEWMAMHIIHSDVISTTFGKKCPKLSNNWGSQIMLN